jgi:hypothetical protein
MVPRLALNRTVLVNSANAPLAAEDAGIDGLRGIQSASDRRAVGSSLQRPLNKPFYCVDSPTPAPKFETIPSSSILQACRKTSSHHPTVCHADRRPLPDRTSMIHSVGAQVVRPPFRSHIREGWHTSNTTRKGLISSTPRPSVIGGRSVQVHRNPPSSRS